jgi:serine O-acetyltransferase
VNELHSGWMVGLTATDLLVVYLIPLAVLVAFWLLFAVLLYALVRLNIDVDLRHDLLRKYSDKEGLPSMRGQKFSLAYTAKILAGDNCIQAAFLYRIARFLARHRLRVPAEMLHALSKFLTHLDISPWADIGPGVYFYHGLGTVVGKGASIGKGALICQGVSVGGATIGDDVKLWAGAKVLGRVTIGDRSEVGANAVVIGDVPSDSVVFGIPARLAGKTPGPRTTNAELRSSLQVQRGA